MSINWQTNKKNFSALRATHDSSAIVFFWVTQVTVEEAGLVREANCSVSRYAKSGKLLTNRNNIVVRLRQSSPPPPTLSHVLVSVLTSKVGHYKIGMTFHIGLAGRAA